MNTIRMLSLALLAGIGVAGAVWYFWGVIENIAVLRKGKSSDDEAGVVQNEDADSLDL